MTVEDTSYYVEQERVGHECGIGMIYTYAPTSKKDPLIAIGHALQHRGQNGAGILSDAMYSRAVGTGLLNEALTSDAQSLLDTPSHWAMIHLRYGTSGGYSNENLQPIQLRAVNGDTFTIEVNGNNPLMERIRKAKGLPAEWSDTRIAAQELGEVAEGDWDEAILRFAEMDEVAEGANNMFIGVGDAMYVLRDKYRLHPFAYGDYHGEGMMFASETVAFQKLGLEPQGEVPPGAVIKLTPSGMQVLRDGHTEKGNACIFEPAYFSGPNSHIGEPNMSPEEWMSVMRFRTRCGETVAEESPVSGADYVVGMPDSGWPFTNGYANRSGIPTMPGLIRSHYNGDGRTFMNDSQMNSIPAMVRGKIMPVIDEKVWRGKNIVVCDDSLVRGNNSKEISLMLRKLGVNEIHWRFGFPQVRFPCPLGVSFRSQQELAAAIANGDNQQIAALIGVTSVGFISDEGIIRAAYDSPIPLTAVGTDDVYLQNGWCGGCVTGKYPINLSCN